MSCSVQDNTASGGPSPKDAALGCRGATYRTCCPSGQARLFGCVALQPSVDRFDGSLVGLGDHNAGRVEASAAKLKFVEGPESEPGGLGPGGIPSRA